ncbi:MAG: tetratricopeptide repeat protein [Anaerolineales bacterium]|nr:tetratricopeptide repeat protein [Anaerolineales bacterium]
MESVNVENNARREIRVFISSTFNDMQAERDELAKFVFPRLRKRCQERGVSWTSIDLRWGIPAEEVSKSRVLSICLNEIQRCKPYFIGILGERYGWIPETIDPDLAAAEPWLVSHGGRSITDLEILHGVLNDPQMASHAFFYFRDPAHIETLPKAQQDAYREAAGSLPAQKLAELKDRIRSSGLPLHENYADPRSLGQLVETDLAAMIDRLFPEDSSPQPFERESLDQQAFAASRFRVYLPRAETFARLDDFAAGNGPPLVVLGESGSGKSALLANWANHYRQQNPTHVLLEHYIGSTPTSVDWQAMLRRIMTELQLRFDIRMPIPEEPAELRLQFANWLGMIPERARLVLVLDALDQLDDQQGALDLVWLPVEFPPNVRVVLSTLQGRPLEAIKDRNWPTVVVDPMNSTERRQLITSYLNLYRKKLDKVHLDRIAAANHTDNPLFLRTLLEELRIFGQHEHLSDQIEYYLESASTEALFEKILERYEHDYNRERTDLVQQAFSLIWASRRGLSETELLDMLGINGESLPRAYWSPLYLAAETSLIRRDGLIGFFHRYLEQAVQQRYLPTAEIQEDVHRKLAFYFGRQEQDMRVVEELAWQLLHARDWDLLVKCLSDQNYLKAAWETSENDVKMYWAEIEKKSSRSILDAYQPVIDDPQKYSLSVGVVGHLLHEMGNPREALSLAEFRILQSQASRDIAALDAALRLKSLILRERGDLDAAMDLQKALEATYRETGQKEALVNTLNSQAVILKVWGDLAGALALHQEQERICQETGDRRGLGESYHNQGTIRFAQGDYQAAQDLFQQANHIMLELGDKAGAALGMASRAAVLLKQENTQAALSLFQQAEQIHRLLGDKAQLKVALNNQAIIHARSGDFDQALSLSVEQEKLCRETDDSLGLAICLNGQGLLYKHKGELNNALERFREAEKLAREVGAAYELQAVISNQASIYHQLGEFERAKLLREEEIEVCRQAGYQNDLARALFTMSELLIDMRRMEEGLPAAQEAYELAKKYGLTSIISDLEQQWFPG